MYTQMYTHLKYVISLPLAPSQGLIKVFKLFYDGATGVIEVGWGVIVSSVSRLSGCGVHRATNAL